MKDMKDMKNIAFVCNHLFGGGAERVLVSLANYYAEEGYNVHIIVFDGKKRYYTVPSVMISEVGDTASLLTQSLAIRRELKRIQPEVIIAFEYFVNLAVIIASIGIKAKVIVSERNDPSRVGSGLGKDQLRNFLYRYCDVLVCQTPDAKKYFPQHIQKHTVIIPNPIKENLPEPWKGERIHKVVNFCRMNDQKNLKLLINAFKAFHFEFPDYELVLFGDGPEKEPLKQYVQDNGMSDFVQLKSNAFDVHEQVVDSAMFVSSSDYEGLSNSMLEALAIGLPTICTDCPCGGARMMIRDGENGILVPVGDRSALTEAMKRVADNKRLSEKLSIQGAKLRNELSIDKIAQRWEDLF